MKKLVLVLLMVLFVTPVMAQSRGALTNSFASWYQTTANGQDTISFPANSRDIYIRNGSSSQLWVGLDMKPIPGVGNLSITQSGSQFVTKSTIRPQIFIVDADSDITLTDCIATGLTMTAGAVSASPVTVIVTY